MHDVHSLADHDIGDDTHSHSPAATVGWGLSSIIYTIGGVIALFLAIRFLFVLLGAGNAGIVNFVYQLTGPFVAPFFGLFNKTALFGTSRIEIESLLAIILVAIVTYLIAGIFRSFR